MLGAFVMNSNAQFVNIPDPNFKKYLTTNFVINTNFDTEISLVEASAFSGVIYVNNDSISSLVGIEAFVNITELWCDTNQISSLDVSKNVNLSRLGCNVNNLTSLILNSNLINLNCVNNKLPSLDVSQNVNLIYLWCGNNQLTNLDVSKNVNLVRLGCEKNQLSTLDISKNLKLEEFWCLDNPALNVDIINNVNLTRFGCQNNSQVSLDFKKCANLTFVVCSNNPLISLDISQNINLTNLYCNSTLLTNLNLNNTTKLSDLYIGNTQIDTIDISNLSNLNNFNAVSNSILKIIYVSTTQDTTKSTWNKDITAQYRIKGAKIASTLIVRNEYYTVNTNTSNLFLKNITINDTDSNGDSIYVSGIVKAPKLGVITGFDTLNGIYSYQVSQSGMDTIIINVCNNAIPSECKSDTAFIFIIPETVISNTISNDNYSIENTSSETFLNVLANDNAVGIQNLFMDLQPDTVGLQQNVKTSFGEFKVINQNQLYFTPINDTVGSVTINYKLVDTAGVSVSNKATITVNTTSKLKFYSGFSPNGDNININFYITNVRQNSTVKLNVFDMNGFVVYTNDKYDNKWEGLDKDGKKLSPATYYYIVQYQENSTSDFVQYNGFVEIKY